MGILLEATIANEIAALPLWAQWLTTAGPLVTVVIGFGWKVVAAFRKGRREAMEEAMRDFEEPPPREPTQRTSRALPEPPPLPDEVYERIHAVEVAPVDDDCRAELRVLKRMLREEQARAARVLLDLTRRLGAIEDRCDELRRERDELAERLEAVERADTDRPPPITRRRQD